MGDWVGIAVFVTLAILYIVAWLALLMATLDQFTYNRRGRGAALALALLALTVAPITVGVTAFERSATTHGSCKYEHWVTTGKTSGYVCDEYYPLPQVVQR